MTSFDLKKYVISCSCRLRWPHLSYHPVESYIPRAKKGAVWLCNSCAHPYRFSVLFCYIWTQVKQHREPWLIRFYIYSGPVSLTLLPRSDRFMALLERGLYVCWKQNSCPKNGTRHSTAVNIWHSKSTERVTWERMTPFVADKSGSANNSHLVFAARRYAHPNPYREWSKSANIRRKRIQPNSTHHTY